MRNNLYAAYTFLLFLVVFAFTACDIYEQDEYQELIVLEAYAIAGRPLPDARISTTLPADEEYTFDDAAISDATIVVTRINSDGNETDSFSYIRKRDGLYEAENKAHRVEAGSTYQIDVQFHDRPDQLRAETTVPEQFEILNEIEDSYIYQTDGQLEILLSATGSSARQNIYVFNTLTLEPSIENLTPFYRDAVENGDSDLAEFLNNSSGLINEGNFDINEDQTILLRFPWIGVAFFGENAVVTNSVDQNLADLVRSEEFQLGGSTLPPGEIPNLVYNVEGGIGVFGSIATDTIVTRFLRPQ